MPGPNNEAVQSEGDSWRLNFRALRVFNDHLQGRKHTPAGCNVCQEGLEGVVAAEPRGVVESAGVAAGDGADKAGDTTSSPSGGTDPEGEKAGVHTEPEDARVKERLQGPLW